MLRCASIVVTEESVNPRFSSGPQQRLGLIDRLQVSDNALAQGDRCLGIARRTARTMGPSQGRRRTASVFASHPVSSIDGFL